RPRLGVAQKVLRAVALWPKPIEISIPSIGQCHTYHLQFETADGLHIVEAKIRYSVSVLAPGVTANVRELEPPLTPMQQRVGLLASGVALNRAAAATFSVRPRPSMIVRSAFLASLLGCAVLLLSLLARAWLSVNPTPWVTVLLIVPGALSAYIGLARENLFATEVLRGLRLVSLFNALWSFSAAAVLVLSRKLTVSSSPPGAQSIGAEGSATGWVLLGLLLANVATAIVLFIAWRRSQNPPEFRKAAG
ncbi:MAG TPA: hypothetical protein VNX67_07895, partial [Solirubrobacteraceae bacterium]|nr:hypothetical protein [Solirubrobacteraceae bacterium]